MSKNFNDLKPIDKEIIRRIEVMEEEDYDFGPAINKTDKIAMIVVSVVCVLGMIWGYF